MNCLHGTYLAALPTGNALPVPGQLYVHTAELTAATAMGTAMGIHRDAQYRAAVEQAIPCTQRTQKSAEWPIDEYHCQQKQPQQNELPGRQPSGRSRQGRIHREQRHGSLQRSCRTYILAEQRLPHPGKDKKQQGKKKDEQNSPQILQLTQPDTPLPFPQLRPRQPEKQLLDQSERTKPAADHAAKQKTHEHQAAQDIKGNTQHSAAQRTLQCSQWTGPQSPRAGIAVQTR